MYTIKFIFLSQNESAYFPYSLASIESVKVWRYLFRIYTEIFMFISLPRKLRSLYDLCELIGCFCLINKNYAGNTFLKITGNNKTRTKLLYF